MGSASGVGEGLGAGEGEAGRGMRVGVGVRAGCCSFMGALLTLGLSFLAPAFGEGGRGTSVGLTFIGLGSCPVRGGIGGLRVTALVAAGAGWGFLGGAGRPPQVGLVVDVLAAGFFSTAAFIFEACAIVGAVKPLPLIAAVFILGADGAVVADSGALLSFAVFSSAFEAVDEAVAFATATTGFGFSVTLVLSCARDIVRLRGAKDCVFTAGTD